MLDADIENYFVSIAHDKLLTLVGQSQRPEDARAGRRWLQARVMEDGVVQVTCGGNAAGWCDLALLSNIYLHVLDRVWAEQWPKHHEAIGAVCGRLRLVDVPNGTVVLRRGRQAASRHAHQAGTETTPTKVKTRRVVLTRGQEGLRLPGLPSAVKRMSGRLWQQ
ncbi:MAG: hypothetical protein IPP87_25555 [Ideonella sp.]|nr:hypothetical protein [Ideonella sp.]